MTPRIKALCVHLLTATGVVWAMLAMLEAVKGNWAGMFFWLLVALIVDGVDGPLARHYEVKKHWPTYDGVLMDMIVDYLTYVFIPAFALFNSGLLPGWSGWVAIIVIVFGSVLYFADTRMKTKDWSFAGFPAAWNMPVLVIFALKPVWWASLLVVVILTIGMFTNMKFVHPVRTERWRWISLPMTVGWICFASLAVIDKFQVGHLVRSGLIVTSVWLMFAGFAQQLTEREA